VVGVIVRDEETRAAIADTTDVGLPVDAGAELRLVVRKSRYRLEVWRGDERIKVYPVALGGEPQGAKEREGDHRTPEGEYFLIPHHPSPSFGACFYVCYPSEVDAKRGVREGIIDAVTGDRIRAELLAERRLPYDTDLGGLILIHGTKNRFIPALTTVNWTNGCIAMENDDVIELLAGFSQRSPCCGNPALTGPGGTIVRMSRT